MTENIERQIIVGLLFNDAFISEISDFFDQRYIESPSLSKVAQWALKYFSEQNKAPQKHIETIFHEELKNGNISDDQAEGIQKFILPVIKADNEQEDINPDYLLKVTKQYFIERHAELHNEKVMTLFDNGKPEKAAELMNSYQPLEFISNIEYPDAEKVDQMDIHKPRQIMSPWLNEGEYTLIYADVGVGKSLLAMLIGYVCGMKNYDNVNLGDWFVRERTGCLFVDGELGYYELKNERYDSFTHLGEQAKPYRMRFYSISNEQMESQKDLTLGKRENQKMIIDFLKTHEKYKLLILDNISTVFGLEDDNSSSEWNNKINPFLRDLRALEVAVIILDHSGKDKKRGQRGSSAKTVMASNVFSLSDHPDKNPGEAWFVIEDPIKQRSAGMGVKSFNIRFHLMEDAVAQTKETTWEIDVV
ncbi:MAG: AAA family ATPase [Cyclobacteriaceae bacterium]